MPALLHRFLRQGLALILALSVVTCTDSTSPTPTETTTDDGPTLFRTPTGMLSSVAPKVFVGAGDIASCSKTGDSQTAALLDDIPGDIFLLGDNVYPNGTASEFENCFGPTWGRHKDRMYPSAGNHEYNSSGAAPYFAYFGAAAGEPGKGYYSFDLGAWHVIVLNSNISKKSSSPQLQWLRADLAANPNHCTLAFFHHPLYSSTGGTGTGGRTYGSVRTFYDELYEAGADLVLTGHRHVYERMAKLRPDGTRDAAHGTRHMIAGTGGIGGGSLTNLHPGSEVRNGKTRGVLKLYLYQDSYAWKFVPIAGKTFTDSGSTACHTPPSSGNGGGGVSPSQSTVTASPTTLAASNGSSASTVTVTVKDGNGDPMSGVNVVLSATGSGNDLTQPGGPTGSNGVATGTLSSTGAGQKTVSATANGTALNQKPVVTVEPGSPDAGKSTVSASPGTIQVGSGSSTISVTAKDAHGNPVSGADVTLEASGTGNTLGQPNNPTNGNGVATGTLSSSDAGQKIVSAKVDGTAINQTATVSVSSAAPASIEHSLLTVGADPTNQKVFTTAPISPAANALVTVAVLTHRSTTAAGVPTLTGGGMSDWSTVATVTFDNLGTSRKQLTIFRAMQSSPGSGPLTIRSPRTVSHAEWIISQWTGVNQGGTNGAGAIVQTGSERADASNGLAVSLSSFQDPNNVAYGVFGVASKRISITPGNGFTEIAEQTSTENTTGDIQAEWAVNRRTIDATWSNLNAGALGVEIRAGLGP